MTAGERARGKRLLSETSQSIISPECVTLDSLTRPEKIVDEARLLAAFSGTSTSAFAFNGLRPSPVAHGFEMIWNATDSNCGLEADSNDGTCLMSHWEAAREALKACVPTLHRSCNDNVLLFSCPIVLGYRGRFYPKAVITVVLPHSYSAESIAKTSNETPDYNKGPIRIGGMVAYRVLETNASDTIRRSLETLASAISEEISMNYLSYREEVERELAESRRTDAENCYRRTDAELIQDVTERLLALREIERYRKLVDNADDFVLMSSIHGSILTWNRKIREVLGYSEDELRHMNGAQLHPRDELDKALSMVQEAMENERARGELHLLTKDGRQIPTEVIVTFSRSEKTFQAIFRDITERIAMEKELQKRTEQLEIQNKLIMATSKQKSQFFANMSHELRTPLTSIIGFTELIIEDTDQPVTPEQRSQLNKVVGSAQRLLGMINDLLDLSKIEAGKMTMSISRIDVRALVEQAVSGIEPLVRDKDIELATAVEKDLPILYTDEQKLEQILVNLLSNASKYTDIGRIYVEARCINGKLHISVSDTGVGIKRTDLKQIFDEFCQVEQSNGRKSQGTGLGLTIARKLANQLGGDIKVKSKYGEGSIFTLVIPFSLNRSLARRRSRS